jgi:hypothetical protein
VNQLSIALREALDSVGYRSIEETIFPIIDACVAGQIQYNDLVEAAYKMPECDQPRTGYLVTIITQTSEIGCTEQQLAMLDGLSHNGNGQPMILGEKIKGSTGDYLARRWGLGSGMDRYRLKQYKEYRIGGYVA